MPTYSPDELKSIVLHYGSYEKARKKLKIGKATLVDAANADIKGTGYKLKPETTQKISRHLSRLAPSSKKDIREWETLLNAVDDNPHIKKTLMNATQSERIWIWNNYEAYESKLKERTLWTKLMGKLYDRHGWQRGRFSK